MKLSNTMTINESLLPSNKKAFTLAEVLITLSILGVVAAITIPSLVNRNSDIAAWVKLKKAVSNYEDVAAVYMVENEVTDLSTMLTTGEGSAATQACTAKVTNYFKAADAPANSGDYCTFTTSDGAYWQVNYKTGYAYITDSKNTPRYGVVVYAKNGQVNGINTTDGVANAPSESDLTAMLPSAASSNAPLHGNFAAASGFSSLSNILTTKPGDGYLKKSS